MPPHLLTEYAALIPIDADTELSRLIAGKSHFVVIDPFKWGGVLPERRARIEAMLQADYRQVASFPYVYGPLLLYRLRD